MPILFVNKLLTFDMSHYLLDLKHLAIFQQFQFISGRSPSRDILYLVLTVFEVPLYWATHVSDPTRLARRLWWEKADMQFTNSILSTRFRVDRSDEFIPFLGFVH